MKCLPALSAHVLTVLVLLGAAGAADAAGDPEAGAKAFAKCKACHSITAPDGTAIQKGAKVGPNLYGVIGRPAASYEGFKYGEGIKEAGAAGLVWDETNIAEYVKDPTTFLETFTNDPKAKSKMIFKLPSGGEDVAAYLASVVQAQ